MRQTLMGVGIVYLMLGSACNFHCKHCVQHDSHPRIKKSVAPKVIEWLKHVANCRPEQFKPTLMFWGGEPLLYRQTMKDVVEQLGDIFNYSMVSNGALLTDEDVAWLNKHKIHYTYSNDGVNTKLVRDKNMFEDEVFVERFNRIEDKGVDGVLHAMNQDFYAFWDYVQKKSPQASIYWEDLICSSRVTKEYSDFDFGKLAQMYNKVEEDVINGIVEQKPNMPIVFMSEAIGKIERAKEYNGLPACTCCRRTLDIDVNGKIYLCHNSDIVIGTVDEEFETYSKRGIEILKELMAKRIEEKKCRECSAFLYCKGGCPFEVASPIQEKSCEAKRMYWATAKRLADGFNGIKE